MSDDTTHPSLLSRLRDPEDFEAWREFETTYRDLVVGYCRRCGLQQADCDDIQQNVWLQLAKGMRNFKYDSEVGRFRDYLRCVVRNAIARHYTRPHLADRALGTTMLSITPNDDSDGDEAWEAEWVDHHYRIAMQVVRRTFDTRSIAIFDRLVSGRSVSSLADEFSISEQAVHKVKQRIRDRMAELIERQIRDENGLISGNGVRK